MTKNSIFDVGRNPESTIDICAPYFHLGYSSEKLKEILKNLSKAFEKHLERDSFLEKIKVLNQALSICRKTDIV